MTDRVKLLVLTIVSLGTRLFMLGGKSLWIDECLAWGATRMGWMEMFRSVASGTPHPPVAFALIKLSAIIAGDGEFGLRFLIAVFTASAVVPLYRLAARRTTARGGFYAGLLWALSPFAVSLGQECWVYGINAALSFWFADVADLAWRGSRKAYITAFILGIAGILTQHIFVITVAASAVLYFSIDAGKRISILKFITVPLFLAAAYLPVYLYFSSQFAARTERLVSAGFYAGTFRLFSTRPLSELFRVFAGGLLPEISQNILERPRMFTAYLVNAAAVIFMGIVPLFRFKKWNMPGLRFLWIILLLPFLLFINDDPTIRHLSLIWLVISISSAAVFSRYRYSGPAAAVFMLIALVPYYRMDVFPYHRSNWHQGVETIEAMAAPGDGVVIFGGKSTAFAWEFYSETGMDYFAPGGETPFAVDSERSRVNRVAFMDSVFATRENRRIWVLIDVWGSPEMESIKGDRTVSFSSQAGDHMLMILLEGKH